MGDFQAEAVTDAVFQTEAVFACGLPLALQLHGAGQLDMRFQSRFHMALVGYIEIRFDQERQHVTRAEAEFRRRAFLFLDADEVLQEAALPIQISGVELVRMAVRGLRLPLPSMRGVGEPALGAAVSMQQGEGGAPVPIGVGDIRACLFRALKRRVAAVVRVTDDAPHAGLGVIEVVAVEEPILPLVGVELNDDGGQRRHIHGVLERAGVGAGYDAEEMAVQMQGVVHHRLVREMETRDFAALDANLVGFGQRDVVEGPVEGFHVAGQAQRHLARRAGVEMLLWIQGAQIGVGEACGVVLRLVMGMMIAVVHPLPSRLGGRMRGMALVRIRLRQRVGAARFARAENDRGEAGAVLGRGAQLHRALLRDGYEQIVGLGDGV